LFDCCQDLFVRSTTAQVPGEIIARLFFGGVRVSDEKSFYCHDHPGGAKAALEGLVLEKGLLHGVEIAVLRQAFDRRDVFVLDVAG